MSHILRKKGLRGQTTNHVHMGGGGVQKLSAACGKIVLIEYEYCPGCRQSSGHRLCFAPLCGLGLQINPLPKTANIGLCLTAADKGRDIMLSLTH